MIWISMTFFQRMRFILEHGENIFVRTVVAGKVGSYSLSELPEAHLLAEVLRLACRDVEPTRVVP